MNTTPTPHGPATLFEVYVMGEDGYEDAFPTLKAAQAYIRASRFWDAHIRGVRQTFRCETCGDYGTGPCEHCGTNGPTGEAQ